MGSGQVDVSWLVLNDRSERCRRHRRSRAQVHKSPSSAWETDVVIGGVGSMCGGGDCKRTSASCRQRGEGMESMRFDAGGEG